jgi:prolipoprotein diacylglyceryltransferase
MVSATLLFFLLYLLSRRELRRGVLTLTFGAWYGAMRVVEDFMRVDKRIFGLTGSQWTGGIVSILCIVTLLAWRRRARSPDPRDDERLDDVDEDVGEGSTVAET